MKKLSIFLVAVLLTVSLFVSCDNTTKAVTDEHVAVTFSTGADSRSLSYVIENVSELNWYYTAQKNSSDTSPFSFGATTTETQITLGSRVEFSQGLWDFTLCARRVDTQPDGTKVVGDKVYQGDRIGVLITKENSQQNNIIINVSPVISGVNGSIKFDGIYIALKGDSKTKNVYPSTALIVDKNEGTQTISLANGSSDVISLTPGDYKVTVYHTETIGNDTIEYASETLFVTVWSGRETTIKGNITELTGSAIIDGNIQIPTIAAISKTATAEQETIFKASVAPVNNLQSTKMESTTVSFAPGALNAGDYNLSVEVTNKVEDGINIGSNMGNVATLNLSLKNGENNVSDFNGESATITTYIAKDLTGVKVSYNGSESDAQPIATDDTSAPDRTIAATLTSDEGTTLGYNSTTGLLRFKTTHFSEFEVSADTQARIGDKKYCSLQTAVDVAEKDNIIILESNINLSSSLVINGGKKLTIDLNEHDISASSRTIKISNANVTLTGRGTIYETIDDQIGAIILEGSSDSNDSNYSVVTVGKNVTLRGWSGIFVSSPLIKDGNNYGVVANVYGEIVLPGMDTHNTRDGAGIYINGQNNNTEGNVPVFNLDGAEITGNSGIYAAGYAKWNFANVTIKADSEALSIKAGEFVIDGGTYKAKGAYADPSEDTSNGSVETGAALSMTSNDSYAHKIDVTVNNGHFESENGYSVYEGIPNKKGTSTPVAAKSYVTLRINGGEFVGNTETGAIKLSNIKQLKVITKGTFSSDPINYIAEDCKITNQDGKFVVSPIPVVAVSSADELKIALSRTYEVETIIRLTKDIDLSSITSWNSPESQAIDIQAKLTIDGNNKSINNLTSTNNMYGGLIGKLNTNNNVEIKNLNLNNVSLTGTNVDGECAGGALIGWMDCHGDTVSVHDVTVNGVSIDGFKYSGGLIGYKNGDTPLNITGCSVNGIDSQKKINSSYNESGNYKGHIGGLVGYYGNGNIKNCTLSNIAITRSGGAQNDRAGVLVGTLVSPASITSARISNVTLLGTKVTSASNMFGPGASTGTTVEGGVTVE